MLRGLHIVAERRKLPGNASEIKALANDEPDIKISGSALRILFDNKLSKIPVPGISLLCDIVVHPRNANKTLIPKFVTVSKKRYHTYKAAYG